MRTKKNLSLIVCGLSCLSRHRLTPSRGADSTTQWETLRTSQVIISRYRGRLTGGKFPTATGAQSLTFSRSKIFRKIKKPTAH